MQGWYFGGRTSRMIAGAGQEGGLGQAPEPTIEEWLAQLQAQATQIRDENVRLREKLTEARKMPA